MNEKHTDRFNKLELHYNRLVQTKKDYAKKIGADFRLYTNKVRYSCLKISGNNYF